MAEDKGLVGERPTRSLGYPSQAKAVSFPDLVKKKKKHTYMHTYIHTCIHTYIHKHIHRHIQTHIQTHRPKAQGVMRPVPRGCMVEGTVNIGNRGRSL